MSDDERLKSAFEKLRAEDARRAPSFEATRQRRRRARVSPWVVIAPIVPAMAAAAMMMVWCTAENAPMAPPPRVVLRTQLPKAPLDFLLEIPGLRETPKFDRGYLP